MCRTLKTSSGYAWHQRLLRSRRDKHIRWLWRMVRRGGLDYITCDNHARGLDLGLMELVILSCRDSPRHLFVSATWFDFLGFIMRLLPPVSIIARETNIPIRADGISVFRFRNFRCAER